MYLQPCPEPSGRLDPAPLTVLCGAAGANHPGVQTLVECAGFWGADDRYYVRRTIGRGTEWLVGSLDDQAEGEDAAAAYLPAALPVAAPLATSASRPATRLMLVGRQHPGRQPTERMAMQVCVRRVRQA